MTAVGWAVVALLVVALGLQAALPGRRLLIVTAAAGLAALLTALGGGSVARLWQEVPWDVLVIVVSLGLLSEQLATSRVFHVLAVAVIERAAGSPVKVGLIGIAGMYAVSALVNNLTALLLVLPVLLGLLKLVGVTRRFVRWTLGPLLVACNLGGAATPIGDFPAILLLGRGAMTFGDYLARALPQTLVALTLVLLAVTFVVRPGTDLDRSPLAARLALRTTVALHRRMGVDRRRLAPGLLALGAMLGAWTLAPASWGVGPELVAWLGATAALVASPALGEELLRRRVDVEAALFLFGLFVLVGAVRQTGALSAAADALLASPLPPQGQLAVFLVVAAGSTALFSAGPSMAALLDVGAALAGTLPGDVVYVGLAMSVCAGSSLFLTAATAGPLAQSLTERADLRDAAGEPIPFGFADHLGPGLLGFAVTLAVGLAGALLAG